MSYLKATTEDSNPKPADLKTLDEFLKENDKILATLGVFVALAAFFMTLPMKSLSTFLALVCLLFAIPLFVELYKKTGTGKAAWNRLLFTNLLGIFAISFISYVLLAFREQWKTELHRAVFWIMVGIGWWLYKKAFEEIFLDIAANSITLRQIVKYGRVKKNLYGELCRQYTTYYKATTARKDISETEKDLLTIFRRNRLQKVLDNYAKRRTGELNTLYDRLKKMNGLIGAGRTFFLILLISGAWYVEVPVANTINEYLDKEATKYRNPPTVPTPTPTSSDNLGSNTNVNMLPPTTELLINQNSNANVSEAESIPHSLGNENTNATKN
jgi:hypothetical protein